MTSFNFPLQAKTPLSTICRNKNLHTFEQAAQYIQALPYRRNSRKDQLSLVFTEQCGTCSTKHAALKALADENDFLDLDLVLGIYSMQERNTPGVGPVLQQYGLDHIPEAHNYLQYQGQRLDYTGLTADTESPFESLSVETIIQAHEIGARKVDIHKKYLQLWLDQNDHPFTLAEIWKIREACIAALANPTKKIQ